MRSPIVAQAHEAWGEWLSGCAWQLFATWTAEGRVGPIVLLRAIQRWIKLLEVDAKERSLENHPGIGWIVGLEQPRGHVSPHAHGLLVGVDGVHIKPHWARWLEEMGRAKIEPVNSRRATSFYCTKYALKDGEADFYLSSNLVSWFERKERSRVNLYPPTERALRFSRDRANAKTVSARRKPSDRRTHRAAVHRTVKVAPGSDVARIDDVERAESPSSSRKVWLQESRHRWTLGVRTARELWRPVASVHRDFAGRWFGTKRADPLLSLGPYGDLDEARVAVEAVTTDY